MVFSCSKNDETFSDVDILFTNTTNNNNQINNNNNNTIDDKVLKHASSTRSMIGIDEFSNNNQNKSEVFDRRHFSDGDH